jgi:hypothetical protein
MIIEEILPKKKGLFYAFLWQSFAMNNEKRM